MLETSQNFTMITEGSPTTTTDKEHAAKAYIAMGTNIFTPEEEACLYFLSRHWHGTDIYENFQECYPTAIRTRKQLASVVARLRNKTGKAAEALLVLASQQIWWEEQNAGITLRQSSPTSKLTRRQIAAKIRLEADPLRQKARQERNERLKLAARKNREEKKKRGNLSAASTVGILSPLAKVQDSSRVKIKKDEEEEAKPGDLDKDEQHASIQGCAGFTLWSDHVGEEPLKPDWKGASDEVMPCISQGAKF
jgi:hypothetical protein